jgi:hypothetical protein
MRRDVVADGRWRDAACLQAQPAQWLDHKLMRLGGVPSWRCSTIGGSAARAASGGYIFQAARARYVKTKRVWSAAHREISR